MGTLSEDRTLPPWSSCSTGQVRDRAAHWLASPALRELVLAQGGPDLDRGSSALRELVRWTSLTWDTRRGQERHQAPPTPRPEEEAEEIVRFGECLGLISETPFSQGPINTVVVLGGTARGNQARAALAARVVAKHGSRVIALGSERMMHESEWEVPPDRPPMEWEDLGAACRRQLEGIGAVVSTISAPNQRDGSRATTASQLKHLCEFDRKIDGESLALITTSIYVPYQFFTGAGIPLQAGARQVRVIGSATVIVDHQRLAQRILQELHSAIRAVAPLLRAVSR